MVGTTEFTRRMKHPRMTTIAVASNGENVNRETAALFRRACGIDSPLLLLADAVMSRESVDGQQVLLKGLRDLPGNTTTSADTRVYSYDTTSLQTRNMGSSLSGEQARRRDHSTARQAQTGPEATVSYRRVAYTSPSLTRLHAPIDLPATSDNKQVWIMMRHWPWQVRSLSEIPWPCAAWGS